jgi:hypothetical protein
MVDYDVWCNRCKHSTSTLEKGVLCGLTNEKPTFKENCELFDLKPAIRQHHEKSKKEEKDFIEKIRSKIKEIAIEQIESKDADPQEKYNQIMKYIKQNTFPLPTIMLVFGIILNVVGYFLSHPLYNIAFLIRIIGLLGVIVSIFWIPIALIINYRNRKNIFRNLDSYGDGLVKIIEHYTHNKIGKRKIDEKTLITTEINLGDIDDIFLEVLSRIKTERSLNLLIYVYENNDVLNKKVTIRKIFENIS